MEDIRLAYLFQKQIEGGTTENEKQEFFFLLSKVENEQFVKDLIDYYWNEFEPTKKVYSQEKSEDMLREIHARMDSSFQEGLKRNNPRYKRGYFNWGRYAVAASIILAISAFYFLLFQKELNQTVNNIPENQFTQNQRVINEVGPGGNKAILTLDDGTTINLDNTGDGLLAHQGSAKVNKHQDGQLVYTASESQGKEIFYNSVSTPNGGQYKIKLSDGTDVWLNAASSIKYPALFTGTERNVEITGEVYFEVQENKNMPFIVNTKKMQVAVLGTHFNINAYIDEPTAQVTLLEGSVNVKSGVSSRVLKPGEQAAVGTNGQLKSSKIPDTNEVIAWTNGMFHFSKATTLESVMKQLARWYDVTIEYEGNIPNLRFGGEVSRASNLSEVLKILKESGVNFKLEGKKIVVGQ